VQAETFEIEVLDVGPGPTLDTREAALVPRRHRPRVHRVQRLGRIDGEPVALLTAAFPAALAKVLTRRVVATGQTFPALVAQGLRPGRAEVELEVTFASGAESVLLEVAEGAPLVMIRTRLRTESGELLALTRQLYRSDRFQFAYTAQIGADGWADGCTR
jgi:DNA-binding GntR family transcriptional regulator